MENVVVLKINGHNGVELEEEFQTFCPEVDYKKEANSLTLKNGYLSSAFLEEMRYHTENPSDDIPYDEISVLLEDPDLEFVFRKAKLKAQKSNSTNGKFEIVFSFDSFDLK